MDEQKLVNALERMKESLPVNAALKEELRAVFRKKRRIARAAKWSLAAMAAALLSVFALNGLPGVGLPAVNASSLKVMNQVSFVEVGSGTVLGVAEHKGDIYVPVAGQGVFVYNASGFHKLTDREMSHVSVSRDGHLLLGEASGTIGFYDHRSGVWKEILKGNDQVLYEQPVWKEGERFVYVRKLLGPNNRQGGREAESGIYEWRGDGLAPRKLADGSAPSPVSGKAAFVYEKEDAQGPYIAYRETETGAERVIDRGHSPSVSPDGRYVAYVKSERTNPEWTEATAEENAENVWVADTDGGTRRPVTANPVQRPESAPEEGQQGGEGGTEAGRLPPGGKDARKNGLYRYSAPSWSSDAQSLFALKTSQEEGARVSLMRLDLSARGLNEEETVRAFEQAVIERDLDYARSLLKGQSEFFIGSNPHRVSYLILGSGSDNGRAYVDVEEYWSYTADAYYGIERVRYYVVPGERGYVLEEGKPLGGELVTATEEGGLMLEKDGRIEMLLTPGSIPSDLLPKGDYRISSLAYIEKRNLLLFTLQVLQDEEGGTQKASIKLIGYDTQKHIFRLLDERKKIGEAYNIGAEAILISPDGRFAAMDLFADDEPPDRSHMLVYDVDENRAVLPETELAGTDAQAVRTFYWDGHKLHFTVKSHGQTMHLVWDAVRSKLSAP